PGPARQDAPRCALRRRGATAHRRRPRPPLPDLLLDGLLPGTATDGGTEPAGPRHRRGADGGPRALRQGGQGSVRALALAHAHDAPRVLGHAPPSGLALPGPRTGSSAGHGGRWPDAAIERPEGPAAGGTGAEVPEGDLGPRAAPQLRDPSPRSRRQHPAD